MNVPLRTTLVFVVCLLCAACCDLGITTQELPDASLGRPYTEDFAAECDNGNWELVTGSLPPGLSFSNQGRISGTPTAPGYYEFAVGVGNDQDDFVTKSFSLLVHGVTRCEVSLTNIDFGAVSVGMTTDRSFTIDNTGDEPIEGDVSISTAVPCDGFAITAGSGFYCLEPGESHTVMVRFSPTTTGAKTCRIDTGNSRCDRVDLSGTGQ